LRASYLIIKEGRIPLGAAVIIIISMYKKSGAEDTPDKAPLSLAQQESSHSSTGLLGKR